MLIFRASFQAKIFPSVLTPKSLRELEWVNLWGTLVAESHIQRDGEDGRVSGLQTTNGDIRLASRIQVVFELCQTQQ